MTDQLILFLVVLSADLCASMLQNFLTRWKKQKIELLKCELCEKPRKIRKTRDEKHLACRTCRKLYNDSLKQEERQAEAS